MDTWPSQACVHKLDLPASGLLWPSHPGVALDMKAASVRMGGGLVMLPTGDMHC